MSAKTAGQLVAEVEEWVRSRATPLNTPEDRLRASEKGRAALAELVSRLQTAEATALAEAAETEEHKAALVTAEAQVAALTVERDEAQVNSAIWQDSSGAYCERMLAAEARVATLTTALEGLKVKWPDGECFCHVRGTDGGVDHMEGCEAASRALGESKE